MPYLFRCVIACSLSLWVVSSSSYIAGDRPQAISLTKNEPLSSGTVARLITDAPEITEVAISANGEWVAYTVAHGSVEQNSYRTELLLQRVGWRLPTSASPLRLAQHMGDKAVKFTPRWRPDGYCLAYFADLPIPSEPRPLVCYELADRRVAPIRLALPNEESLARETGERPPLKAIGGDYRWSPSSKFISFTAASTKGFQLDPARGVLASREWIGYNRAAKAGLFVLDVTSGISRQLSSDEHHVLSFDWSPDERQLVYSAAPDAEGIPVFRTNLFVVDRETRKVRPLVAQPGLNSNPHWSPDGKWIAFTSHFGFPTYYAGWPAIVSAAGGAVVRLAQENDPKLAPFSSEVYWARDSRSIYFSSGWDYHMTRLLLRVTLPNDSSGAAPVPLRQSEEPVDDHFSMTPDTSLVAFTREALNMPPELYLSAPTAEGFSAPRRLTDFNQSFPLRDKVDADTLSWPSRDGKFTIHGVLLTPASAWDNGHTVRRLPTLVYLAGGPSMFVRGFKLDFNGGAQLSLAVRGYAVLVPNTRGRGGYGEAFQRGMRDGPSAGRLPFEDAMGGLDLLIKRGIADPARLGVYGHSYGGYLTSYVTTQTNRFKAAVVHEGAPFEWLTDEIGSPPDTDGELLMRDLYGWRNPFDPDERARLVAESPGFNIDKVATPTLLLYGAHAGASSVAHLVGRPLHRGMQWGTVASEFIVFDEGHVFERPAAVADSLTRTADWFDFWIRGYEDPEPEKQKQYARWRKMRDDREAPKAVKQR